MVFLLLGLMFLLISLFLIIWPPSFFYADSEIFIDISKILGITVDSAGMVCWFLILSVSFLFGLALILYYIYLIKIKKSFN